MNSRRKTRTGRVVSNRMDKTVVVVVETPRRHPLYRKIVRHVARYKAHDEGNQCQLGDLVRIVETRPLSGDKRWRVAEVTSRQVMPEVKPEEVS